MLNAPPDSLDVVGFAGLYLRCLSLACVVLDFTIEALESLKFVVKNAAADFRATPPSRESIEPIEEATRLRGNQLRRTKVAGGGEGRSQVQPGQGVTEGTRTGALHPRGAATAAIDGLGAHQSLVVQPRNKCRVNHLQHSATKLEEHKQWRENHDDKKETAVVDWNKVKKSLQDGFETGNWESVGESVKDQLANVDNWSHVNEFLERVDWKQVGIMISTAFEEQNAKKNN